MFRNVRKAGFVTNISFRPFCILHVPAVTRVDTISGREWAGGPGTGSKVVNYPRSTWLSPLNRRDTLVHLTDPDTLQRGGQWRAPLATAAHYKFTDAPRPVIDRAVVNFEFTGMLLSNYLMNNTPAR